MKLTEEEIRDAVRESDIDWHTGWTLDEDAPNRYVTFARAIEAALSAKQGERGVVEDLVRTMTALHGEVDAGWSPDARSHLARLSASIGMLAAAPEAKQEVVACERCEELGYDKATYFRLYEQACIELQAIKKQTCAAEIKVSYSALEGEVIEVLSCDLGEGTHNLYTHPAPSVNAQLLEALKDALATIEDYLDYEHNGDPWTEDARSMGEMDVNDYKHDGRLDRARAAIAAAEGKV